MWRKAINTEPHVPDLHEKTLREKIDQDTRLLASLNKNSDAYRRLQARIAERTTRLLDYEDTLEQRQRQAAVVAAEQARRDSQSSAVGTGLVLLLIGVLAIVVGWGTWWIAAGIVAILFAVCSFAAASDI
ncbi:hypothetical protein [Amycolatopsis sp. TNS106]|uniref:hypothetical protein n=1 Tax=Amycolatopsis sp. TNS106 TaxID=2861750 RepID=UPI001C5693C2|nr:hypothetical protein [Amycolatopsis sp. TNS106]QXV63578.1 hypothetical protein CVV72_41195 [Amycolatopsis sp. TNS106]